MKILLCFEGRVRADSTGFYLLNALKQLGHKVDHVTPDKIMEVTGGYDYYLRCDDGLKQYGWNPALHPSHYYCIDTHIETDWRLRLAEEGKFDSISVVHSDGLELPWPKKAFWIPVGCDRTNHNVGPREKMFDGCFIGNFHNNLAGPRIEALDVFARNCPVFFFGNRTFQEMAEKYAQSRLVFNRSINGDANMRVFEAMASGSCLVTDRVKDLDKLGFIDKSHYFGYSSTEELEELTKMLLREHSLRERVAETGQQEVLNHHTYQNRMESLLEKTKGELCKL